MNAARRNPDEQQPIEGILKAAVLTVREWLAALESWVIGSDSDLGWNDTDSSKSAIAVSGSTRSCNGISSFWDGVNHSSDSRKNLD